MGAKLRRVESGVEARIRELQDAGELSGLPGEGRPLPADLDHAAGDAWAARHVFRTSGARPLWSDLRRDITERRMRIVTRLRAHLAWLERRQALLEHLAAERIVSDVAMTKQTDDRVRAEVAHAVAELNALIGHHNLVVTATPLHLGIVTLEGLIETARSPRG
ncbi:MAG: DnaJ family domain-containing protein [Chloroflexota bacterium]